MDSKTQSVKHFLEKMIGLKSCKPHVTNNPFETIMETGTNIFFCTDDLLTQGQDSALSYLEAECRHKITNLHSIIEAIQATKEIKVFQ
jgi:uncharacterized protein with ACT and thioredoxin-like domain